MNKLIAFLILPIALLFATAQDTRLVINVGTTANDNTGDSLRNAFIKVNTNFYKLWSQAYTNIQNGKLDTTNGVASGLTLDGTTKYSGSDSALVPLLSETMAAIRYSISGDPVIGASLHSVPNISALTNADHTLVSVYGTVTAQGYVTQGDLGGGQFRKAANTGQLAGRGAGGIYFAFAGTTNWVLERIINGYVTPEMFGAVGDGSTDDTAAANAAMFYAAENGLRLAARKSYKLGTSSLLLPNNTVIDGEGTGEFIRAFAGNGTYTNTWGTLQNYPLALLGSYTNAAEVQVNTTNITLRNLKILNADANVYTNGRSLALWGVRGVVLENCFIGPIANGWAADIWADEGVVSGCIITNVAEVFSDGFHLIGGRRWTIANNQFYGGDDALALLQVYDHSMSDITVANNYLRSYKAHPIRIGRWDNVPAASQTNLMERLNIMGNVCEAGWRNGGIYIQDQLVIGTNYTKLLKDITISDTKILLRSDYATGGVTNGYGIRVVGGKDIALNSVTITNAYGNSLFNHVDGLTLDTVSIRNNNLFNASFQGNTTVTLNNCDFASDRASSTVAMYGNGAVVVRGGTFNNSGAVNGILIEGTGSDNVSFSQVRFTGNGVGINLNPVPATFSALQCDFASTLTPISYSGAGAGGTKPAVIDLIGNVNLADYFRNASVTYVVPITKSVGSSATMETYMRTDTSTSATVDMQGGFLSWHTAGNWFQYESLLGIYGRNTTANSTQKKFGYHVQHYNTSEEPLATIWGDSASSTSDIYIGGGSSVLNAATTTHIYAAANTTTTTGTEIVRVTTAGLNVTSGALSVGGVTAATVTGIAPAFTTLTSGTTVTWTMDSSKAVQNAHLTLATNATLSVSGIANGMTGVLIVQQDGSGGRTLALPANSKVVNGGAGAITLTSMAGAFDVLSFTYNGTNYFWTYGKNFN